MTKMEPWRDRWPRGGAIAGAPTSLAVHWFSAVVWDVLAVPLGIELIQDGFRQTGPFMGILLSALVLMAIPITYNAFVATVRARRFKNLRLQLDPFPGTLGGQAGGSVDVPVPLVDGPGARVELTCVHSRLVKTRKGTTRAERAVWTAETVPVVEPRGSGCTLRFAFDVPEGLPESEDRGDDYHYWVVRLSAAVQGPDLDVAFRVPVYRHDPPLSASIPTDEAKPDAEEAWSVSSIGVRRTLHGTEIRFGFGRFAKLGAVLLCVGILFAFAAAFAVEGLGGSGGSGRGLGGLVAAVFAVLGGGLALTGLHLLTSRITLRLEHGHIEVHRTILFFFTFRRDAEARLVKRMQARVGVQTGYGPYAVRYYKLTGVLASGGPIPLGNGIRGAYLLTRLGEILEAELGATLEMKLPG